MGTLQYIIIFLQNGAWCYCGDEFGRYGKSYACDTGCPGNSQTRCGGPTSNNIYAVHGKHIYMSHTCSC